MIPGSKIHMKVVADLIKIREGKVSEDWQESSIINL